MSRRTRTDAVFLAAILLLASLWACWPVPSTPGTPYVYPWDRWGRQRDPNAPGCKAEHKEWFHDENTCTHDCCMKMTGRYGE